MDVPSLIIAAFVSGVIAVLILLHHGWKHSHDDLDSHARTESCAEVCYFQPSDVCKRTWNHETFIVIFAALAIVLAFASIFFS